MAQELSLVYILARICEALNHRELFNDPKRTAWSN